MPTLRVHHPETPVATYVLTGPRITVGRRPDNTIQIIDRSVSAYHAELVLVDGHYRLHDLNSTNRCFVEGEEVVDFHLRTDCKLSFGQVPCSFAVATEATDSETSLTPAQTEKELAFLRAENQELRNENDTLRRRVDMLSSARLVTRSESVPAANSEELKRIAAERDEIRFQNSGLKLELDKLREELARALHERDSAMQAYELSQDDRGRPIENKGATQRIIFPSPVDQQQQRVGP